MVNVSSIEILWRKSRKSALLTIVSPKEYVSSDLMSINYASMFADFSFYTQSAKPLILFSSFLGNVCVSNGWSWLGLLLAVLGLVFYLYLYFIFYSFILQITLSNMHLFLFIFSFVFDIFEVIVHKVFLPFCRKHMKTMDVNDSNRWLKEKIVDSVPRTLQY